MKNKMEFSSMEELLEICAKEKKTIGEVMLKREVKRSKLSKQKIMSMMKARLTQMKKAIDSGINDDNPSHSGISGGDSSKLGKYKQNKKYLSGNVIINAMHYAMATSETNAKMGVIVATPTAGACGILPGCLFSLHENKQITLEQLTLGLFTASAIGFVIANRAFISGSAGGCQAEVGSASAMAAGTIVELNKGTPEQAVHAAAIALKSLLGLVCDPVAGLVEVPCVKRNVIGTSIAFSAADMALAGIKSRIPCDEVIDTMYEIGKSMPVELKETALGGLAATKTGKKLKEKLL